MDVEAFLQNRRGFVVGVAAVLPLVACAVLSAFRDTVVSTTAAIGLVLFVVGAAATGIRPAGLAAAVSTASWFDSFLTEPFNRFTIADPADIETAVLLVLVGVAVTEVALWGRRQQARASRQHGYLDGIAATAEAVAGGAAPTAALVERTAALVRDVLEVDRCRFDPGDGPVLARLAADGSMTYAGRPHDVARSGLPPDCEIALPVRSAGVAHGRFLLTAATAVVRPSREQLRVAGVLADQVGAALAAELPGRPPAGGAR